MQANNDNNNDNFLDELNREFEAKETLKYARLSDIPKNINYQINDIFKIKTKYGDKTAIKISHKMLGSEHSYTTILPDRYSTMKDTQINILKGSPNIAFRYKGKNPTGAHIIKFVTNITQNIDT